MHIRKRASERTCENPDAKESAKIFPPSGSPITHARIMRLRKSGAARKSEARELYCGAVRIMAFSRAHNARAFAQEENLAARKVEIEPKKKSEKPAAMHCALCVRSCARESGNGAKSRVLPAEAR